MPRVRRTPISKALKLPVQMNQCPTCSVPMWSIASCVRTVVRMDAVTRLRLQIKTCHNPGCKRYRIRTRPEQEGRIAITRNEYGMDVIALIGELHHTEGLNGHKVHMEMTHRNIPISSCSTLNLIKRHDEMLGLVSVEHIRTKRIRSSTEKFGMALLAIDWFPPIIGTKSLWVIRDTISGEVLIAKRIEDASYGDIFQAMNNIHSTLTVPVVGIIYDACQEGYAKICRQVSLELYGGVRRMSYSPIKDDDGGNF